MNMLAINKYFKPMIAKFRERGWKKKIDISILVTIPTIRIDERGIEVLHCLPLRVNELHAMPLKTLAVFNNDGHTYKKVGERIWQRDDGKVILHDISE